MSGEDRHKFNQIYKVLGPIRPNQLDTDSAKVLLLKSGLCKLGKYSFRYSLLFFTSFEEDLLKLAYVRWEGSRPRQKSGVGKEDQLLIYCIYIITYIEKGVA